jgi:hypothetical protein
MEAKTLLMKRWRHELARRNKRKRIAREKHESYLWKLRTRRVVKKPKPVAKPVDHPKPKTSLAGRAKTAIKSFLRRTP